MTIKEIQEWLCLNGFNIKIDNKFGPVTQSACVEFCEKHGLKFLSVDNLDFQTKLCEPIEKAKRPVLATNLRDALIKVAQQHLAQKPREVGGPNCGPGFACMLLDMKAKIFRGVPCLQLIAYFKLKKLDLKLGLAKKVRRRKFIKKLRKTENFWLNQNRDVFSWLKIKALAGKLMSILELLSLWEINL